MEQDLKEQLREVMEEEADARKHRVANAILQKDTQTLFDLIGAEAEAAFIIFFNLEGTQAKNMRGR